jgi:hypothetical protein
MTEAMGSKKDFARATCLFLAEELRYHKVCLRRAAEIAEKMLDNMNLMDKEEDFLRLVKELSKDFEELEGLEKQVYRHMQDVDRSRMEFCVQQFVIHNVSRDPKLSLNILQDATAEDANFELLTLKYPEFKKFVLEKSQGLAPKVQASNI